MVLATILEGGYLRDGAGMAFALMGVVLVVLVVWSLVKPEGLGRGASRTASSWGPSRLLPVVLACLCVVSVALAAALWWMPHYQVIVPTDKRVILDAKPALTVAVKNHGLFPGTYTAAYAVAGQEESVVDLRLSPGEQKQVTLAVAAGTSTGPLTLRLGSAEIEAEVLRPAKFRVGALKVDPAIVKIGQVIRVRAAVENVGDVSGTFPGAIEANGREADAQPTKIAPGESTTLAFTVSQASAGACRLQLGAARTTVMVVRPVRPPNGRMLRRSAGGGKAYLTVKNTNELDAMLILTRTSAPRTPVLAIYVRRNSKATVNNVPDGRYIAWDCLGSDWNGYMQDFLTTEEHAKWRDPLVFSTTSSTSYWSDASYNYSQRHTNWTNWTITLGSGSSKYTRVSSEPQFPKL